MATRRAVSSNKATPDKDGSPPSSPFAGEQPNVAPAVPAHVIIKLLLFTLAMVVGPIGTYFLTLNSVFGGNSTLAGAVAAIMANAVLVAYIVVAMREDQGANAKASEKKRR